MANTQVATNVKWHAGEVSRKDRHKILGQTGGTVWFTGLSGSGKSTAAVALEKALIDSGRLCYRLDGDNVRLGINKNLGFTAEDRSENIRRIGEVAKLFVDTGVIVLCSFISPYRADRNMVRELHEAADMKFLEVHVDVPLGVAESRDPKGLYKKARSGEIKNFTGIDSPYEQPIKPDLVLPSHQLELDEQVEYLMGLLKEKAVI